MSRRPRIPKELQNQILYDSAFRCVVCGNCGKQIHHIDKNHSNNDRDNLVLLCSEDHDSAHTSWELSLNLTAERLKASRRRWYDRVERARASASTEQGQRQQLDEFFQCGVAWGYINHGRLIQVAPPGILQNSDSPHFRRLRQAGVIDERGILIKPDDIRTARHFARNTVYDWYNHPTSIVLHKFYSEIVDAISRGIQPIHLTGKAWTKTFVRGAVRPGSFIFANRAYYFRRLYEDPEGAQVASYTFKKGIRIEFEMNTRNMYGTTSITCSFSGHQSCAAFLQVKSISDTGGILTLRCSPIAAGVGFHYKPDDLNMIMTEPSESAGSEPITILCRSQF